jgi:FtsZ-binding cell division protein ZapB
MDPAILVAIVGVLAAPFAALITWTLNRKKHIADIYAALSESSQTAVETMQMTMNELRIELEEARRKIDDLIEENELLRHDLHELKKQNENLLVEIKGLRASYEQ